MVSRTHVLRDGWGGCDLGLCRTVGRVDDRAASWVHFAANAIFITWLYFYITIPDVKCCLNVAFIFIIILNFIFKFK